MVEGAEEAVDTLEAVEGAVVEAEDGTIQVLDEGTALNNR
jgi:hypothetical protein